MRGKLVLAGVVWGLAVYAVAPERFQLAPEIAAAHAEAAIAQTSTPQAGAPRVSVPEPLDYVEIDGSKNPEMIPDWSAWSFAFRVIAGGSKLIPSVVLRHLSKDEAAALLAAAAEDQRSDAACQERMLKLRPHLLTDKIEVINAKTREIRVDCRWQTLHTRDRALSALNADGQAALIQWVESTKAAMRVSVPKRELAHYQQPR